MKGLMMIHKVEFQPVKNRFISKLKEVVKIIKNTEELLINADKSSNISKIEKDTYNKYFKKSITKTYKKSNRTKVSKINIDAKKIATKLKVDDGGRYHTETTPLLCKSMDWFLYDIGLRHERVKS